MNPADTVVGAALAFPALVAFLGICALLAYLYVRQTWQAKRAKERAARAAAITRHPSARRRKTADELDAHNTEPHIRADIARMEAELMTAPQPLTPAERDAFADLAATFHGPSYDDGATVRRHTVKPATEVYDQDKDNGGEA